MIKIINILLLYIGTLLAEGIVPIPQSVEYDFKKAKLGQKLFFENGLSKDGTLACASCHMLPGSGADVTAFSFGINASEGEIHSPTVLNSGFNFVQFWDGRALSLEEQAKGPLTNPVEMGTTLKAVIAFLKQDKDYVRDFQLNYEEGITEANMLNAIAEFERALYTPNSRFDQYLRGDSKALSDEEKEGYALFQERGCVSCHNGVNIGGNMYQKFGVMLPYESKKDQLGRYNVTKNERDRYFFKVPTLRNIALTKPYLHDGSVKTLKEVIAKMMKHQLGILPDEVEINKIEAFLQSLTGDSPAILR